MNDQWFWLVLLVNAKAVALVAACLLSLYLYKNSSACERHWMLKVLFAGLLLLPVFALFPAYTLTLPEPPLAVSNYTAPFQQDQSAVGPVPAPAPAKEAHPPASDVAAASSSLSLETGPDWTQILLLAYGLVAVLLLLRLLLSFRRVQADVERCERLRDRSSEQVLDRLRTHLGIRRPIRLLATQENVGPFVWGWRKPSIVVPRGFPNWPDSLQRDVLFHELVHVRKKDLWVALVARVCCCVYWINPLVWKASQLLKVEAEKACDDRVLESAESPILYAQSLVSVAKHVRCPSPAAAGWLPSAAEESTLAARVTAILNPGKKRNTMNNTSALLFAVLLTTVSVVSVGLTLDGDKQEAGNVKNEASPVRLETVYPAYPAEAKAGGIEGQVTLEFDITAAGVVENIRVVESEPADVFDQSATEALEQWAFLPRYDGGQAQLVQGVRTKLSFVMDEAPKVILNDAKLTTFARGGSTNLDDLLQLVLHYRTAEEHTKAAQTMFSVLGEWDSVQLPVARKIIQAVHWDKVEAGTAATALNQLQQQAYAAPTGNRYAVLAAIHDSRKNWGFAQLALAKAFEKGQLDNPYAARFMLAQVLYHSNNLDEAVTLLESLATQRPSDTAVNSRLNRVQKENEKRAYVAQHLLQSALP